MSELGLLPASLDPSRTSSAGYASTSSATVATTSQSHGARWIVRASQYPMPLWFWTAETRIPGTFRRFTRCPTSPRIAGSTKRATSAASATAIAGPIAVSESNGIPIAHSPISAMTTLQPANSTEWPAVPAAFTTASVTVSSVVSASRKRVTTSRA